jgi:hypothetical protein
MRVIARHLGARIDEDAFREALRGTDGQHREAAVPGGVAEERGG